MSGATDQGLTALARAFRGRRCLVVGDVMLDVFERGRAAHLAPDTPAPVITDVRAASSPGGAANVAANLAALGADVALLSMIEKACAIAQMLNRGKLVLIEPPRR